MTDTSALGMASDESVLHRDCLILIPAVCYSGCTAYRWNSTRCDWTVVISASRSTWSSIHSARHGIMRPRQCERKRHCAAPLCMRCACRIGGEVPQVTAVSVAAAWSKSQVPLLVDGALQLPESAAIMCYLAAVYGLPHEWAPPLGGRSPGSSDSATGDAAAQRRARFDAALAWQHTTIRLGCTRLVFNTVIGVLWAAAVLHAAKHAHHCYGCVFAALCTGRCLICALRIVFLYLRSRVRSRSLNKAAHPIPSPCAHTCTPRRTTCLWCSCVARGGCAWRNCAAPGPVRYGGCVAERRRLLDRRQTIHTRPACGL